MKRAALAEDRGASAVEFALVLPLLLLILFGIMEFGWLLTSELVLTNAVSTGARAGCKAKEWDGEDPETIAVAATQQAFWLYELSDGEVQTQVLDADGTSPRRLEVTVSGLEYRPLVGFLPDALLPGNLAAKAVMPFP